MIFQHSSLTYCIPLVKYHSSFCEIRNLAIRINIEAFDQINRKQLNILKTFLEYLEFTSVGPAAYKQVVDIKIHLIQKPYYDFTW